MTDVTRLGSTPEMDSGSAPDDVDDGDVEVEPDEPVASGLNWWREYDPSTESMSANVPNEQDLAKNVSAYDKVSTSFKASPSPSFARPNRVLTSIWKELDRRMDPPEASEEKAPWWQIQVPSWNSDMDRKASDFCWDSSS